MVPQVDAWRQNPDDLARNVFDVDTTAHERPSSERRLPELIRKNRHGRRYGGGCPIATAGIVLFVSPLANRRPCAAGMPSVARRCSSTAAERTRCGWSPSNTLTSPRLFDLLESAQLEARRSFGLRGRHACGDLLLHGRAQVVVELGLEVGVATPAQELVDTRKQTMEERHQSSPGDARSTRAIALE